ncbi:MAG: SEL1-like repeat protein [Rhizobiaceae bacterium]|nr:SEL1-like repeat protein [Rhizobiaceae bacterium]
MRLLCAIFVIFSSSYSYAEDLNWAIKPKFEAAGLFYGGIAPIKMDGKWGFIRPDGRWAIKPAYMEVKPYRGGLIAFSDGVDWGYADSTGKVIVEARYPDVAPFSEDRIAFKNTDKKWAIADKTGKRITDFKFLSAPQFSEGLAAVRYKNSFWGFVDKDGEFSAIGGADQLFNLSEGRAAYIRDGKMGFVNPEGNSVTGSPYKSARAFSDGYAAVLKEFSGEWLWSLIDKDGTDVFSAEPYIGLRDFSENVAPAQTKSDPASWIYVDIDGYGIEGWQGPFEAAYSFREGFALVKKGGVFRFLNGRGQFASDDQFEDAYSFNEGMAPVMKEGKWGYLKAVNFVETAQVEPLPQVDPIPVAEVSKGVSEKGLEKSIKLLEQLQDKHRKDLTSRAKDGDLIAAMLLSDTYANGLSDGKNQAKAFYWQKKIADTPYRRLVDTGNQAKDIISNLEINQHNLIVSRAKHAVAYRYLEGNGTAENTPRAIVSFTDAANNDYADSAYALGTLYETGQAGETNHDTAVKWYLRAAELGDLIAEFNAGWMLFKGTNVARDLERGLSLLKHAAENGENNAAQNLGYIYGVGYANVKADVSEAKKWYGFCATRGVAKCQFSLAGLIYDNTNKVTEAEDALAWALLAKEGGYSKAPNAVDTILKSLPEGSLEVAEKLVAKRKAEAEKFKSNQ